MTRWFRLILWWIACFCAGRYLALAWVADASLTLPIGFACAVFGLYRRDAG